MRILILGASGGCGRWAIRLAREHGHAVTALVRPETPFDPPPGTEVVRGSALDPLDVARALADHEAVISCVGARRVHPTNPWSPLKPPGRVAERSVRALLAALRGSRVRKVAVISAAGVGDSFDETNPVMRWLIRSSTVGEMYADLGAMETVLRNSRLDWLAVRPVVLIDAPPSQRARLVSRFRLWSVIGRADVASWLLRAVTSGEPFRERTPMIGWW